MNTTSLQIVYQNLPFLWLQVVVIILNLLKAIWPLMIHFNSFELGAGDESPFLRMHLFDVLELAPFDSSYVAVVFAVCYG